MKHIFETEEYKLISEHYGEQTTKRSKVRLINHINEGLEVMINRDASRAAMKAYCLHPLCQSDESLDKFIHLNLIKISTSAIILAMEYRRVANSYLSTGKKEDFVGFTNNDIFEMLVADKIQNERDFSLYHLGVHQRSDELQDYFTNWFDIIDSYEIKH